MSAYALKLNQKYPDKNPVRYIAVTNGHLFIVYPWDSDIPVFYLRFEDFTEDNDKYLELRSNMSYSAFKQVAITKDVFDFERPELTVLIRTFHNLHNLIREKESLSPSDAFYEFSKIMFIKIREDAKIHKLIEGESAPKKTDFVFSTHYIESQKEVEPNPFDAILFSQIQKELEKQIRNKKKKRIFQKDERLNLKATTILEVVRMLEHHDLYGIDEDLNGRMFETFLNATVRGKDLGQFFTPRGVVHYMVETAPIVVTIDKTKKVSDNMPLILDGCCGSGGFLIDAMAELTKKIKSMSQLTDEEKKRYCKIVRNNNLWGVDANDKIARISRLNMYLHGDGGSKIFKADCLDKDFLIDDGMDDEEKEGIEELEKYLIENGLKFDLVLTNPPFSISYQKSDENEKRILGKYKIAKNTSGSLSSSEKSNILFIERYKDLLKSDTGELLTIIDDTVLNGDSAQKYRDYILKHFIIIQVVSLPFNTFFRADANVKTSLIHLRRKAKGETQPNIFMAITNNIGHNDHAQDTPARNNLPIIAQHFKDWSKNRNLEPIIINNNDPDEPLSCPLQIFEVPSEKLNLKRLDAFYYSPELQQMRDNLVKLEQEGKISIRKGADFKIISELKSTEKTKCVGKIFKYFEIGDVTIDGTIVQHRNDYFENLPTRARLRVKTNDIVFAKNNSSRGTTILIPKWFDGNLVTTGFIGIRPKDYEESLLLWNILESEFFRKQVYYLAITASQPEVRVSIFKNEMLIPIPQNETDLNKIIKTAKKVDKQRNDFNTSLKKAISTINSFIS